MWDNIISYTILTLFPSRLNFQHAMLRDLLGYTIHPAISQSGLPEKAKIADIGTGTGYSEDVLRLITHNQR